MTGKINFQTGKAILLPVEFQEFQAILNGNKVLQAVNVTGYRPKRRTLESFHFGLEASNLGNNRIDIDNEGACSCEQRKTEKKIKATFLILFFPNRGKS